MTKDWIPVAEAVEVLLDVKKLAAAIGHDSHCCWESVDEQLTMGDIEDYLDDVQFNEMDNDSYSDDPYEHHARRVAAFYVHGWDNPISVHFTELEFDEDFTWPIHDGNHRFTASVLREYSGIWARCCGHAEVIERYRLQEQP